MAKGVLENECQHHGLYSCCSLMSVILKIIKIIIKNIDHWYRNTINPPPKYVLNQFYSLTLWGWDKRQCSKLNQKSCQSCWLESQIINIKFKKSFKKVPGPPPKLSALGWRTGSNLEHCKKGQQFADDILKSIFVYKSSCILIQTSLNSVPNGPNKQQAFQIMYIHQTGTRPSAAPIIPCVMINAASQIADSNLYTVTIIFLFLPNQSPVLKIMTICHTWDLWKLARSCKQLCLLCLPDPRNLPGTALLNGFQSS